MLFQLDCKEMLLRLEVVGLIQVQDIEAPGLTQLCSQQAW